MRRIMFVDDDENVLKGLKVMLHSMRGSWDMAFALGGHEALEKLAEASPLKLSFLICTCPACTERNF
jgi:CheY-like chemotaxis protein